MEVFCRWRSDLIQRHPGQLVPFVMGQSGNPRGRPPVPRDFRSRCQLYMTKAGRSTLEEMASDPKSPHRYRALELIASYAYGHPTQPVSGDADSDLPPVQVSISFDKDNEPRRQCIKGLRKHRKLKQSENKA
jgi:hypothetical protein